MLGVAAGAGAAGAAAGVEEDSPPLFESDEEPLLPLLPPELLPDEEYRSAYQPPPLRMKLPPLMSRCARFSPHFGQVSRAGSEIF